MRRALQAAPGNRAFTLQEVDREAGRTAAQRNEERRRSVFKKPCYSPASTVLEAPWVGTANPPLTSYEVEVGSRF